MSISRSSTIQAIYTDGACSGNPGPGGWGVVIQFANGTQQELGGYAAQSTNNRMELQAAIEALSVLKTLNVTERVSLFTDSEYVKNGITKWLRNWKKVGWKTAQGKTVLNQDLWQILDQLNSSQVQWLYVKAHAGHPGNERADAIARAFSLGQSLTLSQVESLQVESSQIEQPPTMPELTESLDPHSVLEVTDARSRDGRMRHLRDLVDTLHMADAIAKEGYLITSSELADLMEIHASAVTSRGDQWVWRNWQISRVRREGNQILWQLERISE